MLNRTRILASASAIVGATAAAAGPGGDANWGYGHMMGGYGGGMIIGGLVMAVVWGGIIVLIVLGVRWLWRAQNGPGHAESVEILRQRFAKGEIDEEEFRRRKAALEN